MIKHLIKLANNLDSSGYTSEANFVDRLLKSAAPVPAATAAQTPQVGFYKCGHFDYNTYNYFDGTTMYNVIIPSPGAYLRIIFSTSEGLRAHTNNLPKNVELKNKIDSKDKKLSDREFATEVGLRSGWYKATSTGNYVNQYADNYYNVRPDYSILKVSKDGSSSTISLYNFFKELGGNGAIVKQEEYSNSVNAQNAIKKQDAAKAEETAEGSVIDGKVVRSKRGKNLTDGKYNYTTSADGLSFSWRNLKTNKTGTFSEKVNPDKWVDAVRNLNEGRTTEIK